MSKEEPSNDALARIGARRDVSTPPSLGELEPVPRSSTVLSSGNHNPEAVFASRQPVDCLEALAPHCKKVRERYTTFERNLAPRLQPLVRSRKLMEFDWRVATAEDWRDFGRVLTGRGDWEEISLPHYGEPVGPATTFYRTVFAVEPEDVENRSLFLRFLGVDYQAHVFVNGSLAGSHEGFFAPFECEIGRFVQTGANTLVVRVDNDYTCLGESQHHELPNYDGDKIMAATNQGYDEPISGWHHCPPGMGIYNNVLLESRAKVHLHDVFIRPLPSLDRAEVWIEVNSTQTAPVPIRLELSVFGRNFESTALDGQPLGNELEAGRGRNFYRFDLPMPEARLWTPDTPWLYEAQIRLSDADSHPLDARCQQFGMRWFTIDENSDPKGMPLLNGKKIRLRGANTMGHEQLCVMRGDWDRLREDLLLAKTAHMNFLRFTQRPVQKEIYEACDRLGILTQTDLPLFAHLRRNQFSEAVRQAAEMERHVRAHPCNVLVSYINEPFPDGWREMKHRRLSRPDLERFFRAATEAVRVENPDRIVKPADGDYDPPTWGLPDNHCYTYWYLGHGIDPGKLHKGYWQAIKSGWNYGCGEFGAEGIDRLELLEKYCPKDWLPAGPGDTDWSPKRISKAQTWKMGQLFFDPPANAQEWIDLSRKHQAKAIRRMAEAFRRDSRNVSCAIHLFIDAWPTGWMKAIVDVDRVPKPAYYAYREALTPLMVNLRMDRIRFWSGESSEAEVWLCNDTNETPDDLRIHWQLEDADGSILHAEFMGGKAPDCSSVCLGLLRFKLPAVEKRQALRLRAGLFQGGTSLHQTEQLLEVFPFPDNPPETFSLGTIGEQADQIALNIAAGNSKDDDLILCSDFVAYQAREAELLEAVAAGRQLILLEVPPGEHCIANSKVVAKESSMGPHYFVSRRTEHPWVAEFESHDFDEWYHAKLDRPAPIHDSVLIAPEWQTVLRTTDHGWATSKTPEVAVCAEKHYGSGRIVLCQLKLEPFLQHNPPATLFLNSLLSAKTRPLEAIHS